MLGTLQVVRGSYLAHTHFSKSYGDIGLHLVGLQALCLPNFKTSERAQNQTQRISGLMSGGAYTSEARS